MGSGGRILSWAFRGPRSLYFIRETEATEKFMHEGLRSDLPLEAADLSGSSNGRSQVESARTAETRTGQGRLRAGRGGDFDLGWESPMLFRRSQVTARCRSGGLKRQSRRGMETWAENST